MNYIGWLTGRQNTVLHANIGTMEQQLKKDYFWNALGTLLQSAISPMLLVVVTRINGITDSGILSFAISISVIFWAIGVWGGRTYQASDTKAEYKQGSYVALRFITSVLIIFGAIVFCTANGYVGEKLLVIMTMVTVKALESIADALFGVMQVNNLLYKSGVSLTIKAVLGSVGFILVDYITGSLFLASLCIVLANLIVMIFYDIVLVRQIKRRAISRKEIHLYFNQALKIMKQCMPIFGVMFMTMFALNIPRYYLDVFHSSELGYFGIMAMPITLLAIVVVSIMQPNILQLSRLYRKNNKKNFRHLVARISLLTLLIGVVGWVLAASIGIWILNTVFGIEFNNYHNELMVMMTGAVLNSIVIVFVNILVVMRHFKYQFYTMLLTNVVLVPIAYCAVSKYSMIGATISFSLISLIQAVAIIVIYYYHSNKKAV